MNYKKILEWSIVTIFIGLILTIIVYPAIIWSSQLDKILESTFWMIYPIVQSLWVGTMIFFGIAFQSKEEPKSS